MYQDAKQEVVMTASFDIAPHLLQSANFLLAAVAHLRPIYGFKLPVAQPDGNSGTDDALSGGHGQCEERCGDD